MMDRLVVARLLDGRLYKGTTADFHPKDSQFTITVTQGPWKGEKRVVTLKSLKALFFVKSLDGNREYREKKLQIPEKAHGQKIIITFHDSETIRGTTTGFNLGLNGFYLFPSDHKSNNKRIFIARSAVKHIKIEK